MIHSSPEEGEETLPRQVQELRSQTEVRGPRLYPALRKQANLHEIEASETGLHGEFEDSQGCIIETLSQKTNPHPLSSQALCSSFSLGSSMLTSSSPTTFYICHSCPRDAQKQGQNQTDFHIRSRSFLEPQSEVPKACAPVPIAGDSLEDQEEGVVLGKKPAPGSPGSRTERAGGGAVKRIPEWNLWEGDACAEGRGSAGPARQERPGERSGNSGERRARGKQGAREGARAPLHGPEGGVRSRRPPEAGRSGAERRARVAGVSGSESLLELEGAERRSEWVP